MTTPRAVLSWSSGKDAAFTLHELRRTGALEIVGLLTTVNTGLDRASMHGTRRELLELQAEAAGLPLHVIDIPFPCPNETYEAAMATFLTGAAADGITHCVFGDLFLEEVRQYREERLAAIGITPVFPLWGRPTDALARAMIASGLDARIVCLDPQRLDRSLAGARFDDAFLAQLPEGCDPCGENGEFHTCVVAGPTFSRPIDVQTGKVVERDGFVFTDLVPRTASHSMAQTEEASERGALEREPAAQ